MQLKRYPELLKRRREIIEAYDRAFQDLPVMLLDHYTEHSTSSGRLYLVRLNGRKSLSNAVAAISKNWLQKESPRMCIIHRFPMLTAYKNLGFRIEDYPNAYRQFENEITLPLHTKLTDEEILYVMEAFRNVF